MSNIQSRIYLASQSPRRRELLKQIGVPFELLLLRSDPRRQIGVDETPHPGEFPADYVQRVCMAKARKGIELMQLRFLQTHPVLAADTTVTLDGKILGKPESARQAADMLRELAGREHQVLTAVAVATTNCTEVLLSTSTVRFANLNEARIKRYLQSNEYADKAGGYGIQGQAAAFIEHLSGSYSGVMGLPLFETIQLLQRIDFPVP